MKQKFIAIPSVVYRDLFEGNMIASDLMVYMYLCSKAAHGKPIFTRREVMVGDLGGISLSRLTASFKRLIRCGHLKRTRLNGVTSTQLLTYVKDKNTISVKGLVQE
jgi:hypothetical protein|tara:strand:- start:803 stop:1120 length:318 start_codon:yes stop_codon:yes gene_type:complete